MGPFTGIDLVGAAAFSMALFSAVLLMGLLSRARQDVLLSPAGWRLVAAAVSLFALRGFAHFLEVAWADTVRHLAGLLAAVMLPAGLYLVLQASRTPEVRDDLASD